MEEAVALCGTFQPRMPCQEIYVKIKFGFHEIPPAHHLSKRDPMKRGEVWWVQWDPDERRPVLLLSGDEASDVRGMLIVPSATINIHGIAVEVKVGVDEGLAQESVLRVALARPGHINCTWFVTLQQADLVERVGVLSAAKLHQLEDAFRLGGIEQLAKSF
jgi:mRNA interferase MazF